MSNDLHITTEAAKLAPPAVVSALHWGGMTPSSWVTVLTLLYLALQLGLLVPKYVEAIRTWWHRRPGGDA
ncbi:hypothetical protein [Larsenimonas suaedae]|uniref:Holin n=1 Tax=Larsenimonas suaedae TaxID=1851019 RepID=A0ABU1GYK5_9GAMM|nr:hypothetical protein [Larsenimonas suaedae]MCM2973506.1 hypothetical protein [Larsenimonas suaedae]MDR5897124.1 hypothetical protein [Larsenimonas suaedae]